MLLYRHPPMEVRATMRVELDRKSLFALASDTRVGILRSLQPMRRTVSQLAESLDIDKAAIHRHLKKLEEGGLVKRYEDHGFVYYGLSWKARDLMSPNENTRIIVLLSVASFMILGAVVLTLSGLGSTMAPQPPGASNPNGTTGAGGSPTSTPGRQDGATPSTTGQGSPWAGPVGEAAAWALRLLPPIALALSAVVAVRWSLHALRRPKQGAA